MNDKLDGFGKFFAPIYGAITGGVISYGEEFILTILLAAVGAAVSSIVSHLVKRYLNNK